MGRAGQADGETQGIKRHGLALVWLLPAAEIPPDNRARHVHYWYRVQHRGSEDPGFSDHQTLQWPDRKIHGASTSPAGASDRFRLYRKDLADFARIVHHKRYLSVHSAVCDGRCGATHDVPDAQRGG